MDKFLSYYDEKNPERFLAQQRFGEPRRILRLKIGFQLKTLTLFTNRFEDVFQEEKLL